MTDQTDRTDAPRLRHLHAGSDGWHSHDEEVYGHLHDDGADVMAPEDIAAIQERVWKLDHLDLTTVGVDVGSSTSHLMFARLRLERLEGSLSSRFVVVDRELLWRSPILLTPYLTDGSEERIDAGALGEFVREAYRAAGIERSDVDSGAVILTGEALRRTNARAIAELFADEAGKFVCASAGHNLEALMSAYGSGAVELSRTLGQPILNVDIGGGTTKLALIDKGEVLQTAAVAIGGRLLARDERGRLARVEPPARRIAERLVMELRIGDELPSDDERRIVERFVEVLAAFVLEGSPPPEDQDLLLTEPLHLTVVPRALTFSGGVSEYVYGREIADYGDLGRALADELTRAVSSGRISVPVVDPGQGIRATVIGASQFSVQVSGNTIAVSDAAVLPLRNLPVLFPRWDLEGDIDPDAVAAGVRSALDRFDVSNGHDPIALGLRWLGVPFYSRLRPVAEGLVQGLHHRIEHGVPIVVLIDGDIGKTFGEIIKHDLTVESPVLSIDGLELNEFDYVDVGEVIMPTNVVPIVIKSLLFTSGVQATSR